MNKPVLGYTQGTFDMFHIGHLNLLNAAKRECDYLIVGVNSDKLVNEYKGKTPVITEEARKEIVLNIKAVDECMVVDTLDKTIIWEKIHFDKVFIGDDWKGNLRWKNTEIEMEHVGARVVYLPHTEEVSSTSLREKKEQRIKDEI